MLTYADVCADIHGESKTAEFQELTNAYQVLSNPQSKSTYDWSLSSGGDRESSSAGQQYTNSNAGQSRGQRGSERRRTQQPAWQQHQRPQEEELFDDAAQVFRKAWAESAAADYFDSLQQDVRNCLKKARATRHDAHSTRAS
jgi:DnaJ-class molecular chaperone